MNGNECPTFNKRESPRLRDGNGRWNMTHAMHNLNAPTNDAIFARIRALFGKSSHIRDGHSRNSIVIRGNSDLLMANAPAILDNMRALFANDDYVIVDNDDCRGFMALPYNGEIRRNLSDILDDTTDTGAPRDVIHVRIVRLKCGICVTMI